MTGVKDTIVSSSSEAESAIRRQIHFLAFIFSQHAILNEY